MRTKCDVGTENNTDMSWFHRKPLKYNEIVWEYVAHAQNMTEIPKAVSENHQLSPKIINCLQKSRIVSNFFTCYWAFLHIQNGSNFILKK